MDCSCSDEFVAASVACKRLLHAENMLAFVDFSCPKLYRLIYTDSIPCLQSYCYESLQTVTSGTCRSGIILSVAMSVLMISRSSKFFCISEEMVADLLTKFVVGAHDHPLSLCFYSLYPDYSVHICTWSYSVAYPGSVLPGQYSSTKSSTFLLLFVHTSILAMFLYKAKCIQCFVMKGLSGGNSG